MVQNEKTRREFLQQSVSVVTATILATSIFKQSFSLELDSKVSKKNNDNDPLDLIIAYNIIDQLMQCEHMDS